MAASSFGSNREPDDQVYIVRERIDNVPITHPQMVDSMVREAKSHGLMPALYSNGGAPIIYYRGRYGINDEEQSVYLNDVFMMPVIPEGR